MISRALRVSVGREPDESAAIRVAGDVDLGSLDALATARQEALAEGPARVRIDLSSVDFIDSSGLKFLVETHRLAKRDGWDLQLLPPTGEAMDVFRLTGLDERLPFPGPDRPSPAAAPEPGLGEPPSARVAMEIFSSPGAPRIARGALNELPAEELGAGPHLETLNLLVSEVVTNAVIHPGRPVGDLIALTITMNRERTRVEVTDRGAGFDPEAVPAHPDRESGGFGLVIVAAAASRWGTDAGDGGFLVWFELDHAEPPAAP